MTDTQINEKSVETPPKKRLPPGMNVKGQPRLGGRVKGTPNKVTQDLRKAILEAATLAGGKEGLVGYLKTQAIKSPGPFLSLLSKVIPVQVTGANGGPLQIENTHIIEVSSWSPERRAALRSILIEATRDQEHIEASPGLAGAVTYTREEFDTEPDSSTQEP
jgi:hypothetical protein